MKVFSCFVAWFCYGRRWCRQCRGSSGSEKQREGEPPSVATVALQAVRETQRNTEKHRNTEREKNFLFKVVVNIWTEKGDLQVLQQSAKIQEGLRTKEIDGRKPFVKKAA